MTALLLLLATAVGIGSWLAYCYTHPLEDDTTALAEAVGVMEPSPESVRRELWQRTLADALIIREVPELRAAPVSEVNHLIEQVREIRGLAEVER